MAQQAISLPWLATAHVIKTGITAETETTSTSPIPAGWPEDRSFVRLASGHNWAYNAFHYMALERTAENEITWFHKFHDIYNDQDFSPMQFAAELVLLARRPKSIQYVSKQVDLGVDGNRQLTSMLEQSVNPDRALAILNVNIQNAKSGHLSINPDITAHDTLTWNITAVDQAGAYSVRTIRAVVIDP